MTAQDYIRNALDELSRDNKIGAISILEEGVARFRDKDIESLLEQTRNALVHLKDRSSYHHFYEKQQRKSAKYYKFGRRIERKIRNMLGIRSRRIVSGCENNPRYLTGRGRTQKGTVSGCS